MLAGAEDRLIPPAHTLSLACEIASARTATVAGVGHVATLQDPAAVAREVVAFLEDDAPEETTTIAGGNDHGRTAGGFRRNA